MPRRWQVFAVVAVGVFLSSLDLFIVNIAFPSIARDFSTSNAAGLSWVLSAYAIVYAALLVPAGRLADLIGRRRCYIGAVLGFAAASVLCAIAPSVPALVAARVLQAAAASFLLPTSLGLMLPEFPRAQRSVAIGAWAAVSGAAAASGPPLGGVLVQASWRWIFLINVPIGILTALAAMRVLPGTERRQSGALPDGLGTIMLVATVSALVLGIVQGPDWGWTDARVLGSLLAAGLLLSAFLRRTARHPVPVLDLAMLRAPSFALASAGTFLFFAGFAATLLASVLFLTGPWHEPVLQAGLQIAPGPLAAAACAVVGGRIGERFGPAVLGGIGGIIYAAGCLWWATNIHQQPNWATDFLPGIVIAGVGVGLVTPSLTGAGVAALEEQRMSAGVGALTTFRQIGTALGVALVIAILGSQLTTDITRYHAAWLLCAGCAVATSIIMSRVRVSVPGLGGLATAIGEGP